ncbi:bifunctional glycosyltransferase family 2/GtrA family protein [Paenibacillus sp. MBLB2552]|uniref:Bifunctional glycosyltransferase family 2/GtrA family protein n=1 Tax=Paenibacillus mellifer TaxID=2937794 RepID=A0A9X1XYI5_9BACL|nr:bifunctional glycosyltransferase family 2/GtrA family protein [Paenibacillus mellifer]MCK8487243.1 bifunctional glycosyltransferase family 2/GtrA family protein [Paenibacillus mellifer]
MGTILIPAYEPDERLLELIRQLKKTSPDRLVIVDDGSGEAYRPIFEAAKVAGCTVLRHEINRGKGCALKTGFRYLLESGEPGGVVCADSDGQHLPADIMRVAEAVRGPGRRIVLGSRRFAGKVPLRSRFGNTVTRTVFSLSSGTRIYDTQTGLRGFSSNLLEWLCEVPGERFEYEMNMLLNSAREEMSVEELWINTVYLNRNRSSHFRPFADSYRIYLPILRFSGSSILSAGLDFALLFLLQGLGAGLVFSVAGARICSAIANYTMNRKFVFTPRAGLGFRAGGLTRGIDSGRDAAKAYRSMARYFLLVLLVMLLNMGWMHLFHETIGIPLFAAKLLTEVSLFVFSFWAQRKFVY